MLAMALTFPGRTTRTKSVPIPTYNFFATDIVESQSPKGLYAAFSGRHTVKSFSPLVLGTEHRTSYRLCKQILYGTSIPSPLLTFTLRPGLFKFPRLTLTPCVAQAEPDLMILGLQFPQ